MAARFVANTVSDWRMPNVVSRSRAPGRTRLNDRATPLSRAAIP